MELVQREESPDELVPSFDGVLAVWFRASWEWLDTRACARMSIDVAHCDAVQFHNVFLPCVPDTMSLYILEVCD